ncbi:MAG: endonuclease domain-containing protein [Deltaproteobacteria bacterium]|nr:endonuclease domain-containing protein [Deltaproteobacteria bacterium]
MDTVRKRARALRQNATEVEKLLWRRLRMWQVDGYKFRRQQPIGNYIVDFVCLEKRLIVELDGGQHAEQSEYDSERDKWLCEQGFTVLRFWNNDVLDSIDAVAEKIYRSLAGTPFLNPSPQGGRRRMVRKYHPGLTRH